MAVLWSAIRADGRIMCSVPHCPRTTAGRGGTHWLCGDHWKLIPVMRRKVFNRLWKKGARDRAWLVWYQLEDYATEVAAGITR